MNVSRDEILSAIDITWVEFFESKLEEIQSIFNKINVPFTPEFVDVFKVFRLPKNKIRFVVVGQDPYPQYGHATGRSFEREIDNWRGANQSLQAILASIYYHEKAEFIPLSEVLECIEEKSFVVPKPRNLFKFWEEKRGVFCLNKALTTEVGERNRHTEIWKSFTNSLVAYLSQDNSIKWLLWGKEAQELEQYVENRNTIVRAIHPAAFSYVHGAESDKRLLQFIKNSGIDQILKAEKVLCGMGNNVLQEFVDKEVEELNLLIKSLENELLSIEGRKIEIEKHISDFNYRFNKNLGELILKILELKKQSVLHDQKKYEEAKAKEENFKDQVRKEIEQEVKELSEEAKVEIKLLRNRAAKLCHPDMFQNESEEVVNKANEISRELNEAYRINDLERVKHLLKVLESGSLFPSKQDKVQAKEMLKSRIEELKLKISDIEREVNSLLQSDTYQKLEVIQDWDQYFLDTRKNLELELEKLKRN